MSKRIFINGRFLTQPLTGVQRYSHELLRAMDQLNPGIELICLAPPENFPHPEWKNISLKTIGKNRGNLWEQLDLPLWLKDEFLFSPSNIGPAFYSNQAVTMHDASVFAVPQAYSWMFKIKYRFTFRMLAKRAKRILTDSAFSQRELAHYLGSNPRRLDVVLLGGNHLQRIQSDDKILHKWGLYEKPYMLMVASQSLHKNTTRLLQAVKNLSSNGMYFVIVGGSFQGVFQSMKTDKLPPNIIICGYINDSELKALYEHSCGFILPSIYEGFGLPILEAMNCGCPVLSSKAASLPEVGGDAVLYFNPLNVSKITSTIENFISSPSLQKELRQLGKTQASKFTWDKTARQTLDLLLPLI